jgi:hypothetical protein
MGIDGREFLFSARKSIGNGGNMETGACSLERRGVCRGVEKAGPKGGEFEGFLDYYSLEKISRSFLIIMRTSRKRTFCDSA